MKNLHEGIEENTKAHEGISFTFSFLLSSFFASTFPQFHSGKVRLRGYKFFNASLFCTLRG
jgi:hypothetical protein